MKFFFERVRNLQYIIPALSCWIGAAVTLKWLLGVPKAVYKMAGFNDLMTLTPPLLKLFSSCVLSLLSEKLEREHKLRETSFVANILLPYSEIHQGSIAGRLLFIFAFLGLLHANERLR